MTASVTVPDADAKYRYKPGAAKCYSVDVRKLNYSRDCIE